MTKSQKAKRIQRIAESVSRGKTTAETAKAFSVTPVYAYWCCHRFGVKMSTHSTKKAEFSEVAKALADQAKSQAQIARDFGVSRQRIHQIAQRIKENNS